MTKAVLLSVRPDFARALLDGTKTAEIRRSSRLFTVGTEIFVYATSPIREVLGIVRVERSTLIEPDAAWKTWGPALAITETSLAAYLEGASRAIVIEVRQPEKLERPVPLAELRERSMQPSQNYRFIDASALMN